MIRRFIRANQSTSLKLKMQFPQVFSGENSHAELNDRIAGDLLGLPARTVLECGGIDRPLLKKSDVQDYIGLDIEKRETCHDVYHQFLVQSVESPIAVTADMVISTTLLEHVPDTKAAFREMYGALRAGGKTHHYIPCKWHPYSLGLRLIGWRLQNRLIGLLRPEAAAVTGYPVYFDNCSPAALQSMLQGIGFKAIDIKPFYKATDYFSFFVPLYVLVGLFEKLCEVFDMRLFAAGVVLSARKEDAVT